MSFYNIFVVLINDIVGQFQRSLGMVLLMVTRTQLNWLFGPFQLAWRINKQYNAWHSDESYGPLRHRLESAYAAVVAAAVEARSTQPISG